MKRKRWMESGWVHLIVSLYIVYDICLGCAGDKKTWWLSCRFTPSASGLIIVHFVERLHATCLKNVCWFVFARRGFVCFFLCYCWGLFFERLLFRFFFFCVCLWLLLLLCWRLKDLWCDWHFLVAISFKLTRASCIFRNLFKSEFDVLGRFKGTHFRMLKRQQW